MSFIVDKLDASKLVAALILVVVVALSVTNIITIPRIFFDEALAIEIAQNIQLYKTPDVLVAPGHFTGVPYITGSTGYPVTIPLAILFRYVGFGFLQARLYALGWLIVALIVSWNFVKQFWGSSHATAALGLLIGFASLHDSGHRVMGDVPGFALMLLGLLFLVSRNRPLLSGVFFGLALASKPSVYMLIIPAIIVALAIADWKNAWRKLALVGVGVIIPVSFWVILQFPDPLDVHTWRNVLSFYGNAYGSSYSLRTSILRNLTSFGSQTTLMYFSGLAILTLAAFWKQLKRRDTLTLFIAIYGLLDFFYFLRSPGTIRYLLPLELFIILLLPATWSWWIGRLRLRFTPLRAISPHTYWLVFVIGFACLHVLQFVFSSSVLAKNSAHLETLEYLSRYKTEMIGVVSSPHIAAFLPSEQKLHYLRLTDQVIFGTNPLALPTSELPAVIVIPSEYQASVPLSDYEKAQLTRYDLVMDGKWEIYELR